MVERWRGPGGYRELLAVGLPLVFSMMSHTVMQFTDRIFLGNYSLDAIAASLPAGIAAFLFLSFFMGVAEYVGVFVAQYTGAAAPERVGPALWQGLYFCAGAAVLLGGLVLVAEPLFALGGHEPAVQALEVAYFRVLTGGAGIALLGVCLSCFYSGRGLTWPVMLANMAGAAMNIPLDYALINGVWGFPELGIVGAGIATVTGSTVTALLLVAVVFSRDNSRIYGVLTGWRYDPELFGRLMRYGLPGGVQFFLDIFGIALFVFLVGRLGKTELAATNIVISIELLVFLPLIGLSVATSMLVGQSIGAGRPENGARATGSAVRLGIAVMALGALTFVLVPDALLALFRTRDLPLEAFGPVVEQGRVLLRFVAVICLIDAPSMMFLGALKGAGDTHFVMWTLGSCSLLVLALPSYLLVEHLGAGLYGPWTCFTLYVIALTAAATLRFRGGKWMGMRVIELGVAPAGG
ncbi:MAG: MATE family efflux transporter [Deferrisomatales bacterium]|nr:MATE family efflux transporter [Deferrisomatales bacterium]